MPRFPPRSIAAMVLALALLLPACSDSTEAGEPTADDTVPTTAPTTTTTPTTDHSTTPDDLTTTTAALTPEQEVEAAYLEAVRTYYERLQDPDPEDPTIADHHTGDSKDQVVRRNSEMVAAGHQERFAESGPPMPVIASVEIQGDRAIVQNCYIDDVVVFQSDSGDVVDDSVNTYVMESVLLREDDRWKLAEQLIVEKMVGAHLCE